MKLTLTTPTNQEIAITRVFHAPRELVFDCYTKPELLRRWMFGPNGWEFEVCEVDLRVGGKYRYIWTGPKNARLGIGGTFKTILPPEKIINTQLFDEDWTGGEAIVTLRLTEQHEQTTAVTSILHSSKEARDLALQSGMEHGMEMGFERLETLLKMF
jgi:uncharacterized protein YndB with AHSA1/START domain